MSNPKDAFQDLARIFASRGDQVLEIEIIPSSLGTSILQDGLSVGITKKILVQAFILARQLFFDQLISMTDNDLQTAFSAKALSITTGSMVTEVMLLFDCEHLTACNWRKRRLQAAMTHCPAILNQTSAATEMLEAELTLMSSYQCSPLHRHTKSPTLWHHRLWVMAQLLERRHLSSAELLQLQQTELEIVLRAGELHPKNYYAFSYMRQLYALLTDAAERTEQSAWKTTLASSIIDRVIDWCLANPRDVSGWGFGVYVFAKVPDQSSRVHTLERVVNFALNVGWEGECLWTFVDHASRQFYLEHLVQDTMAKHSSHRTKPHDSWTVQDDRQKKSWQTWLARARGYWATESQEQHK